MSPAAAEARMFRPDAVEIARAFIDRIDDACDRLVVAGSLRRRLAMIGDIEIVAVPKIERVMTGLLGDIETEVDRLGARLNELLEDGDVSKRLDRNGAPRWGPTLKYLTYRDARIDLFCPDRERFGWILALRTGPAAFSRQLVVRPDRRTRDGRPGLLPPTLAPADGWLTDRMSGRRIETPEEADVFRLFGLPYREPWERS
jgi:DNA polymerase/3'-5' exonuclease PolX